MKNKVLKIHSSDNLLVVLQDIKENEVIHFEGEEFTIPKGILSKHKFVTNDLNTGELITMYGVTVGKAKQPISKGEQITTFNVKHESEDFSVNKRVPQSDWQAEMVP